MTLAEAKDFLRQDQTTDDTRITKLIKGAREWAENYTNRYFIQQTVELTIDEFPLVFMELPGGQVQSVASINYRDSDDVVTTWDSAEYIADLSAEPARLEAAKTFTFPYARTRPGAVKVRYVVGYEPGTGSPTDYAANVPESIKTAICLHVQANYDLDANKEDLLALAHDYLWQYRVL